MKKIFITMLILTLIFGCNNEEEIKPQPTHFTLGTWQDNRDGNVYKTIQIGEQEWLAENFRYSLPLGPIDGCLTYEGNIPDSSNIPDVLLKDRPLFRAKIIEAMPDIEEYKFVPGEGIVYTNEFGQLWMFWDMYNLYNFDISRPERCVPFADASENILKFFSRTPEDIVKANSFISKLKSIMNSTPELKEPVLKKLVEEARDSVYIDKYGYLYSYASLAKIVPEGWRIPTDSDWLKLELALGMSEEEAKNEDTWRGRNQGAILSPIDGSIPFNVKYTGVRIPGRFPDGVNNWKYKGYRAYFWTSSSVENKDKTYVYYRALEKSNKGIYRGTSEIINNYYSLRLIKEK